RQHLKPTNKSWRVDETYVRVKGRWCYLYRAIDSRGATTHLNQAVDQVRRAESARLRAQSLSFAKNRSHRFSGCTTHPTSQSSSSISGSSQRSTSIEWCWKSNQRQKTSNPRSRGQVCCEIPRLAGARRSDSLALFTPPEARPDYPIDDREHAGRENQRGRRAVRVRSTASAGLPLLPQSADFADPEKSLPQRGRDHLSCRLRCILAHPVLRQSRWHPTSPRGRRS